MLEIGQPTFESNLTIQSMPGKPRVVSVAVPTTTGTTRIVVAPVPDAAYAIRVNYYVAWTDLVLGAVPSFHFHSGSSEVHVLLNAHGLALGESAVFPLATTGAGVTIQGTYDVVQVSGANEFSITARMGTSPVPGVTPSKDTRASSVAEITTDRVLPVVVLGATVALWPVYLVSDWPV